MDRRRRIRFHFHFDRLLVVVGSELDALKIAFLNRFDPDGFIDTRGRSLTIRRTASAKNAFIATPAAMGSITTLTIDSIMAANDIVRKIDEDSSLF